MKTSAPTRPVRISEYAYHVLRVESARTDKFIYLIIDELVKHLERKQKQGKQQP